MKIIEKADNIEILADENKILLLNNNSYKILLCPKDFNISQIEEIENNPELYYSEEA